MGSKENLPSSLEAERDIEAAERIEKVTYELLDAEDNSRCFVDVTYEPYKPAADETEPQQRITQYMLRTSDKEVDLLSLEDLPDNLVLIKAEKDFWFDDKTGEAFVPPPETIVDLYTALHEIGHAVQWEEDDTRAVGEMHGSRHTGQSIIQFEPVAVWLENHGGNIPFNPGVVERLKTISRDYYAITDKMDKEELERIYFELDQECREILAGELGRRFSDHWRAIEDRDFDLETTDTDQQRLLRAAEEVLDKADLWSDELRAELGRALGDKQSKFSEVERRVNEGRAALRLLSDEFDGLTSSNNRWINHVGIIIPNAILERDAVEKELALAQRLSDKLGCKLDFPIKPNKGNVDKALSEMSADPNLSRSEFGISAEEVTAFLEREAVTPADFIELALRSHRAHDELALPLFAGRTDHLKKSGTK